MVGYSGTPLVKKLGIKPGFDVAFVNAPEDFVKQLDLPADVNIRIAFHKQRPRLRACLREKSKNPHNCIHAILAENKTKRNALGVLAKENIRRANGPDGKYRARYWFGRRAGRCEGLRS